MRLVALAVLAVFPASASIIASATIPAFPSTINGSYVEDDLETSGFVVGLGGATVRITFDTVPMSVFINAPDGPAVWFSEITAEGYFTSGQGSGIAYQAVGGAVEQHTNNVDLQRNGPNETDLLPGTYVIGAHLRTSLSTTLQGDVPVVTFAPGFAIATLDVLSGQVTPLDGGALGGDPVPEPNSIWLMLAALMAVAYRRFTCRAA